jgi:hypothetical protein
MSPLCYGPAWSRPETLRRSVSFYFQLSRFQFSLLVFSVLATAILFMFQPFQSSSLICTFYVHFMYMSVLFDSCNLVFCFVLTTRLYACHSCMFAYIGFVMHVRLYGIVREFR